MQAVSNNFKTTILGKVIPYVVQVDMNISVGLEANDMTSVQSVTIDRSVTTDMPDGVDFVTGYPTAEATVGLTGFVWTSGNLLPGGTTLPGVDTLPGPDQTAGPMTVYDAFNPWNANSPLYRQDLSGRWIIVKAGLVVGGFAELVTVFTGQTDDILVDHVQKTVSISCLDDRNELRSLPVLPALSNPQDYTTPASSSAFFEASPGLKPTWVMDTLLRSNGIHPTPPPRPDCLLYASMVGGAFPQIYNTSYALASADSYPITGFQNPLAMTWNAGMFNGEVADGVTISAVTGVVPGDATVDSISGFAEFWLETNPANQAGLSANVDFNYSYVETQFGTWNGTTGAVDSYIGVALRNYKGDGSSWWVVQQTATGLAPDPDGRGGPAGDLGTWLGSAAHPEKYGWHQIGIRTRIVDTTHLRLEMWVDGFSVFDFTDVYTAFTPNTTFALNHVTFTSNMPVEAMQATSGQGDITPFDTTTWTQAAVLDAGMSNLTALVDVSGSDPWQVIQDLAEAELGFAGFDETGIFRYYNRDRFRGGVPVRDVTADASIIAVQTEVAQSLVANNVTAKINALARSSWGVVWSTTDVISIAGGATLSLIATTSTPVEGVPANAWVNPSTPVARVWNDYRACKTKDGTGAAVTNLKMTVATLSPTNYAITVVNPNKFTIYLVSASTNTDFPAGTPMLELRGETITAVDGVSVTASWQPSIDTKGERALQINDNVWRQSADDTQAVVEYVLESLSSSRALIRNLQIIADPSLQLLDRVQLKFPEAGIDEPVQIIGSTLNLGAESWDQSITARTASSPGGWIMGVAGRSEMGEATYV